MIKFASSIIICFIALVSCKAVGYPLESDSHNAKAGGDFAVTFEPNYSGAQPITVLSKDGSIKDGVIDEQFVPKDPVFDDNYFEGWYMEAYTSLLRTDEDLPSPLTPFENKDITGDSTYYALWREVEYAPDAESITFYWNDAAGTSTVKKIRKNGTVASPQAVNGSLQFVDWYTTQENDLDWAVDEQSVSYTKFDNQNLKTAQSVYALWRKPMPAKHIVSVEPDIYDITKTPDYSAILQADEIIAGQSLQVRIKPQFAHLGIADVTAVTAQGAVISGTINQNVLTVAVPDEDVTIKLNLVAPSYDAASKTYIWTANSVYIPQPGETEAELLVVAGGGGGGWGGGIGGTVVNQFQYDLGAGGGGGGVYWTSSYKLTPGELISIVVGKGGTGGADEGDYPSGVGPSNEAQRVKGRGKNGGDSIFGSAGAGGGGGGANWHRYITHTQRGGDGSPAPASVANGSGGHGGGNSGTASPSAGGAKRGNGTAGYGVSAGVVGSNPSTGGGSGAGGMATGTRNPNGSNGAPGYTGAGKAISGSTVAYSHGGKNGSNKTQSITASPGNGGNGGLARQNGSAGSDGIVILKIK